MDTLSFKTKSANPATVTRQWYLVDATNQTLGRLSSRIAMVLRGKNKVYYTPHTDCGDFVIVINSARIALTGKKLDGKEYITYSGYPGGQKSESVRKLLNRRPEAPLERAIRGMLPKNRLGRRMFRKLFVYPGPGHPHSAQNPKVLTF